MSLLTKPCPLWRRCFSAGGCPLVWDQCSADLRERMDIMVKLLSCVCNMFVNPGHNNGRNQVRFGPGSAKSSYPNQTPMFPTLALMLAYWGGLDGFNAATAGYSSAWIDNVFSANGPNWLSPLNFLKRATVKASMDTGAPYEGLLDNGIGQTNYYNSAGARLPLTSFKGWYTVTDPDTAESRSMAFPSANVDPITPANIVIQHFHDYAYAKRVRDTQCGLAVPSTCASDPYGHIAPGYQSPYLGEIAMCP